MAKITYLLGAGASYNSCPILHKQAEAMVYVAKNDIRIENNKTKIFFFEDIDELKNVVSNSGKILWYIGYFGNKALQFGTIDTYAKKLNLQKKTKELNLLKLSVSVFFDLWENFHKDRYSNFYLEKKKDNFEGFSSNVKYQAIDPRYISLFSIFLQRETDDVIRLKDSVNFITWNYDLQLEETFKLFTEDTQCKDLEKVNDYFPFSKNNSDDLKNQVYHLNGHHGYYDYNKSLSNGHQIASHIDTRKSETFEQYWALHKDLFNDVEKSQVDYNKYINYAWEHKIESTFFENVKKILSETEILVIIGYSFPLFNREIDELLLNSLKHQKIKEIVYQDPLANLEILEAVLDKDVLKFLSQDDKIKTKKETNQFYIPNNFNREFTEKEIYV